VLRRHARPARQDTGKSVWSQAAEIVRLAAGPGRLDPDEYYQYRLYDDQRFTWPQKQQFLGRRMEGGLVPILNESRWLGLASDKVIAYAFLRGLGFPIPEPFAVYHSHRDCGDISVLRTPAALAQFVRMHDQAFVAKPVNGMWGRDVLAVSEYDANADVVVLSSGTRCDVDGFVQRVDDLNAEGGMLLQELLTPHPAIRERCGDRICGVRMVTIIDAGGARTVATVWKIATGTSMADNYWEPGNLVAAIDPVSGTIACPFTGLGREIQPVTHHPDTGQPLAGFTLPDWHAVKDLCLRATASIPRLPMQAWDIAITSRGPVLLEVNVNGGMRLPQLCAEAGLLRGEFAEFLKRFGYPRRTAASRPRPRRPKHAHTH
jgi:hypothetical protein